jgi:hypothetical protein
MPQAQQHRRHLLADAGRAVAVNEPSNSAHCFCSSLFFALLLSCAFFCAAASLLERAVTAGSRDTF